MDRTVNAALYCYFVMGQRHWLECHPSQCRLFHRAVFVVRPGPGLWVERYGRVCLTADEVDDIPLMQVEITPIWPPP